MSVEAEASALLFSLECHVYMYLWNCLYRSRGIRSF